MTGADGASFAIVHAITDPEAALPHRRASIFLVPFDTPGFTHARKIKMMGEESGNWLAHSEIRFDNVRLPASLRLGEEGRGFALAQERLGPARLHHCMRWLGNMQRAFDLMCGRAAARTIAEGGVKLAHKQAGAAHDRRLAHRHPVRPASDSGRVPWRWRPRAGRTAGWRCR